MKVKKVSSYNTNILFIAEVKKQQKVLHLTYKDLEKITGIPHSTISAFMSGVRDPKGVKETLAKALKIEA